MSNYISWGIGIFMLLALAFFGIFLGCNKPMSIYIPDKNFGSNGNFEEFQNGLPVNWLVYTNETTGYGEYAITADSLVKKSGKYSLKFDVESCSSKGGRFSPGIAQERDAEVGEKFNISFWALNEGTHFEFKIQGISAKKSDPGISFKNSESFDEWKYFEYHYAIPDGMNKLRIEFNVLSAGKFWLDEVSIVNYKE